MKFIFKQSLKPIFADKPKTMRECILEDLEKTKFELESAYSGFDNVTDPDLIDCYIYELNAIMKRYKYLLNQVTCLTDFSQETCHLYHPETKENTILALPLLSQQLKS